MLNCIHHTAIICSNYVVSKKFYTDILQLEIIRETFREDRQSYKLDLALNGQYIIELFSFPNPPPRLSKPEGTGLRHIAFEVESLDLIIESLKKHDIHAEPIRLDKLTNKRFTFISDPDKLPIEFYER